MSDIFISYARPDRPHAERLAKALEAHGRSVWWDWYIPAGRTFRQVIQEQLDAARCVVVLWSATSVDRDWVIEEATEAKTRGILVPAFIEKVQPPFGFRSIHARDLVGWNGKGSAPEFARLCKDIARLIGAPLATVGQPAATAPSARVVNSKDGYVWIPPGEFWMGAVPGDGEARDEEKPRHRVKISKGFWLGATPVTVADYKRFAAERPGKDDHPIVGVTWEEARAYCEWAGGRLPTEAEWEYAARGGKDGLKYPWGNEITPENANYSGSKLKGTSPVRSYPANALGLYDMSGNVWEWVADWYDEDYYASFKPGTAAVDPRGPDNETGVRVLRGGSWYDVPRFVRVSYRYGDEPGVRSLNIGFRCVREVIP